MLFNNLTAELAICKSLPAIFPVSCPRTVPPAAAARSRPLWNPARSERACPPNTCFHNDSSSPRAGLRHREYVLYYPNVKMAATYFSLERFQMTNADYFSREFQKEFEEAAFRIAEKKQKQLEYSRSGQSPSGKLKKHLPTGGNFTGLFLWDTAFCVQWAKYAMERFPVTDSLDNFYDLQEEDGFICREYTSDGEAFWSKKHPVSFAPPLLSWAEVSLHENGLTGTERLRKVYPSLKKLHEFNRRNWRRPDGLYFGDALGCGMDDLPRFPVNARYDITDGIKLESSMVCRKGQEYFSLIRDNPLYQWNRQMGWVDMSSQMAFDALNLSRIAAALEDRKSEAAWLEEHRELGEIINEKCFDEKLGFYFDFYQGSVIPRFHAGGFWPMFAGIVPPERAEIVAAALADPAKFNRKVPFPALAADDPAFRPETEYWRGSVWPCTNYVALCGLRNIGREAAAKKYAQRYYAAYAELYRSTGTIWENISPEQYDCPKKVSAPDFCGWGALVPVTIAREFLQ